MIKPVPESATAAAANFEPNAWRAFLLHGLIAILILILGIVLAAQVFAKPDPQEQSEVNRPQVDQPVELGDVRWLRDLDTAVATSKKQSKPIAILFQEVPG